MQPVLTLVSALEGRTQVLQGLLVERAFGQLNPQFMTLPHITHVDPAPHLYAGPGIPVAHDGCGLLLQVMEHVVEPGQVQGGLLHAQAADHLEGHGREQKADGRAHARVLGHDHLMDIEPPGYGRGMQRRGAAECDQRAVGQGFAAFNGMYPRGVGHVFLDDFEDAAGRPGQIQRLGLGHLFGDGLLRGGQIEREAPAGKSLWVEPSQHQLGIGDGGQLTAAAKANRTGQGCGAVGANNNAADAVNAPNGAAAGPDFDHFGHGNAHRPAAAFEVLPGPRHFKAARLFDLTVGDETNLGGGAAHVEGQGLLESQLTRQRCRQGCPACRARFDQSDRKTHGRLQSGQASSRGHEKQGAAQTQGLQALLKRLQIA